MVLNIIHLPHRTDRLKVLNQELLEQNILKYKIWDGIIDKSFPQRGISQAHKQIVKYAQEEKLAEILIAEDDLHFTSKGAFDYFIKNKPNHYDIYLGGIHEGKVKEDDTVEDFSGGTLYIVNSRFYDVFLSVPENLNIDRALRYRGKFVVCNPPVAIQHNGFSDNIKQYCNYDEYLRGKTFFRL
jgi:hypothetical protein